MSKFKPGDHVIAQEGGGLTRGKFIVVNRVDWHKIPGAYSDPGPRAVYLKPIDEDTTRLNLMAPGEVTYTFPQYLKLAGKDVTGDFFGDGHVDPVTAQFNRVAAVPPTVMKKIDEISKGHDNISMIERRDDVFIVTLRPSPSVTRMFYIHESRIGIDGPYSYEVTTDTGETYEIGYEFQMEQMMEDLWGIPEEKQGQTSHYKKKKTSGPMMQFVVMKESGYPMDVHIKGCRDLNAPKYRGGDQDWVIIGKDVDDAVATEAEELNHQFDDVYKISELFRIFPCCRKGAKGSYEPGEIFNEKMVGKYRVTLESFRFNEEGSRSGKWTYEVIVYQTNKGGGWTGGRVSEKYKDIEPAKEFFDQITTPEKVDELLTIKEGAVEESFLKHLFKERDYEADKEEIIPEDSNIDPERVKKLPKFVQRLFTGAVEEDFPSSQENKVNGKAPSVRIHDFEMAELRVIPIKDSEGKEGMYELVHPCGETTTHVGYFNSLPELDQWAQENLDDIIIERQLALKNGNEDVYHDFLGLLETQGAT